VSDEKSLIANLNSAWKTTL